ncbi:hypothetical protein PLESTM_002095100 [Pleodorina starrii]|nr:hypothetical protein PLESTM_002095100 [Pleodorina starrii]
MPKNIFVYPCDSFIGRSVSKAFAAAGHAVSGVALTGANVPPSVTTIVRADDSDVAAAHRQLLLTADVVVYDLLGNERATRDAVVQLAQQPYGGREVAFVAVSSPLVWAATRPSPEAVFTSLASMGAPAAPGGEWGAGAAGGESGDDAGAAAAAAAAAAAGGDGAVDSPWAGARGRTGTGSGSGAGTGSGDGEEAAAGDAVPLGDAVAIATLFGAPLEHVLARSANTPRIAPTFRAPEDVSRRVPAASARAALAVEHLVLRATRRGRLRTAVVCPGLLYGEGEDDLTFCTAFKAAWTWQCLPTRPAAGATRPPLLVYGRGTNVLPTLHVADLASYILALTGTQQQQQPQPASAAAAAVARPATAGSPAPATPLLAPAPPSAQTVGSSVGLGLASGSVGSSLALANTTSGAPPLASGSLLSLPPLGGPAHLSNYFLVSDGSRCSQSELVAAIAAALGVGVGGGEEEGAIETVPESELHRHPPALRSRMLLDLSFATTPLPPSAPSPSSPSSSGPGWVLSRPGGLPAQLAAVAEEFRSVRSLTPMRVLVTGPPLSGKTHLARRLAARYGLAYISVPLLLAAAADPAVATTAGLSPSMDPGLLRAAQLEVAAGPSGAVNTKEREKDKEAPNPGWLQTGGRVSAKTLGALLASALADPRVTARCRGFVLDGFPRSAAQARAAFYSLQVDEAAVAALEAEQSKAAIKGHKSHKGARDMGLSANPSTPKLGGGDRGGVDAAAVAGGLAGGGAYSDVLEVPPTHRLVANPLTAPTHVIELDVGEEELRGRLAALAAAAEEAVTRVTGEAGQSSDADKKGPGTPSKKTPGGGGGAGGKGAASGVVAREVLLAAALGHNVEAGFGRRLTAYGNWRAEDAADLRSRVAAAQAAWEAERARQEAEAARLAAEASTLKAKRRRARAAAAAAAAAASGGPTVTISGEDDGDDVAAANGPDVAAAEVPPPSPPELPQHGGLVALSLGAGGATYARLPNPTSPEGPLLTIPVQPPPPAALVASGPAAATSGAAGPTSIAGTVAAAAQAVVAAAPPPPPPPLPALERSVEALLGPPHNLDGFPEPGATPPLAAAAAAPPPPPAVAAADPPAAKVGSVAVEVAAAAGSGDVAATGGPAAAAVEAGADASYAYRWRGSRGAAVRRYMLRHVIPVVTAALAEVALARTGGPVPTVAAAAAMAACSGGGAEPGSHPATPPTPAQSVPGTPGSVTGGAGGPGSSGKEALLHVARALAAAAEAAEAAFVDPYSDPSYAIQLAKIDAKAAREAARAAVAAAKAEREAAARQQQQQKQQLAGKEEEGQQQQQQKQ